MAYSRIIKLLEEDGVTPVDAQWCPGGVLLGVHQGAFCVLGARKGCRGGEIRLGGTIRDPWRLSEGQVVQFWYDEATLLWAGRVTGNRRGLDDDEHVYSLDGAWSDVEGVSLGQDLLVLGSAEGPAGTGTPDGILAYLLDNVICPQCGVTYEAGDLEASGVSVERFAVTRDQTMGQVIEQLELLASSGGGWWAAGVGPDFKFYFRAVSQADADVQVSYEVGANLSGGEEKRERRRVSNSLIVRGGVIPDKRMVARWAFTDAGSVAAHGASRQREIYTPAVALKSDQAKLAAGYFEKWAAAPAFEVGGLVRVDMAAGGAPRPWLGLVAYRDAQRGLLGKSVIGTLTIGFNEEFEISAASGPEEGQGSHYDPSPSHDDAAYDGAGVGAADLPMPFVTDEDEASFDPFGGNAGGDGTGSIVARGQAVYCDFTRGALWYDPAASSQLSIYGAATVANGGEEFGASAVRFWALFYDNTGTALGSPTYHIGQRRAVAGEFEHWVDATGFTIPSSGYVRCGLEVIVSNEPSVSLCTPGNGTSIDWDALPVAVIVARASIESDKVAVHYAGYYG